MGLFNWFKKAEAETTVEEQPKPKVLIVEDEDYLRDFYVELLQGEKFDVTAAKNGQEALTIAQQTLPNVILLDIMMPVMDGMQVLEALKKDKKTMDIPVIVLTNAGNIENMESAKYHKAFSFLIKSNILPEEIIRTTYSALEGVQAGTTAS